MHPKELASKDLVEDKVEDNRDPLRMAKYFNCVAQVAYALLFALFQVVFWSIALSNYLAGPQAFLDTPLY